MSLKIVSKVSTFDGLCLYLFKVASTNISLLKDLFVFYFGGKHVGYCCCEAIVKPGFCDC